MYDLCRIKPDEMGKYTPTELDFMLRSEADRKNECIRHEYAQAYRTAYLCASFTNVHRDPGKSSPVNTEMFLFEYPDLPKKETERTVMNDEDIEATLKNFIYPILKAANGGE